MKLTKLQKYQLKTALLTAFAMCMMHSVRSSWPYIKSRLKDLFVESEMSTFDFLQIQGGAWCFILLSWTADHYNPKWTSLFGLMFLGVIEAVMGFLIGLGYGGEFRASNWIFWILFTLNGVGQSLVFPGISHINSNWFGKGKRGTLMGMWNACIYLGNFYGQFLA